MRTRRSVFFISALCSLFLSSAVFAQERGQQRGQGKLERLAQRLGLDAEQKRQFQTNRQQKRQVIQPLKKQLKAKRQELRRLWQGDAPNRDAILAKHAEMDHIRSQIRSVRIDSRLAMHSLLTPEQRHMFEQVMKDRRGKRKRGRHHQRQKRQHREHRDGGDASHHHDADQGGGDEVY